MYIVVTQPHFFDGEAQTITSMFQSGLERLHLRKPDSCIGDCRTLLQAIPACYHHRIVLHDHFELLDEFGLGGVHLNRRNSMVPQGWQGHVSTSCHSIGELRERRTQAYDYLTLSPIFDSISKQGYNAAFTSDQLRAARDEGLIDSRVLALGGICHDNIDVALAYGFGGVMVLGDAWLKPQLPVILTIAGSDPSAGAGIQQDIKTITHCGGYGVTVITALTSQNTMGVQGVMPVPPEVVESQLRSIFADLRVMAVKTGMIPNAEVARAIVRVLREERQKGILPIVCDPVMVSTSGTPLMDDECIDVVCRELLPLCTLVTPNLPEAEIIWGTKHPRFVGEEQHTALTKRGRFVLQVPVLVKGGHADGDTMTDVLTIPSEGVRREFSSPRIATTNLHGTGCTLSSAIATALAHRHPLPDAVAQGKAYMTRAITGGRAMHIGHGNGPLWV